MKPYLVSLSAIVLASCIGTPRGVQMAEKACSENGSAEDYVACRQAVIASYQREVRLAQQASVQRTGNCSKKQALKDQPGDVPVSGFGTQCAYPDPYSDLFYLQNNKP